MEENKNMTDAKLLARRIAQRAYLDSEEEIAGWIMEFASLYERQQQEQSRKDAYDAGLMCERILAKDEIERLKADRTKLINLLKEYVTDTGAVHTNHKARAEQLLNSLKTK